MGGTVFVGVLETERCPTPETSEIDGTPQEDGRNSSCVPIRTELKKSCGAGGPQARPQAAQSFRDRGAGAAKLHWKVLQLGQTVPHRQHRLGVVDVNPGGKGEGRKRCGKDVD